MPFNDSLAYAQGLLGGGSQQQPAMPTLDQLLNGMTGALQGGQGIVDPRQSSGGGYIGPGTGGPEPPREMRRVLQSGGPPRNSSIMPTLPGMSMPNMAMGSSAQGAQPMPLQFLWEPLASPFWNIFGR